MSEFSPKAETRDMELVPAREQARKLRLENDARECEDSRDELQRERV